MPIYEGIKGTRQSTAGREEVRVDLILAVYGITKSCALIRTLEDNR